MVEFTKQVGNKIGLHLRAAGEFVKIAAQYTSEIRVYHGERYANGKSILGLASLAAARGANVRIEIEGPDEAAARKALEALFDAKFYEDYKRRAERGVDSHRPRRKRGGRSPTSLVRYQHATQQAR